MQLKYVLGQYTKRTVVATLIMFYNTERTFADHKDLLDYLNENVFTTDVELPVCLRRPADQSVYSYSQTVQALRLQDHDLRVELRSLADSYLYHGACQLYALLFSLTIFYAESDFTMLKGENNLDDCSTGFIVSAMNKYRSAESDIGARYPLGHDVLKQIPLYNQITGQLYECMDTLRDALRSDNSLAGFNVAQDIRVLMNLRDNLLQFIKSAVLKFKRMLDDLEPDDAELLEAHSSCLRLYNIRSGYIRQAMAMGLPVDDHDKHKQPDSVRECLDQMRQYRSHILNLRRLIETGGDISVNLLEIRKIIQEFE